MSKQQMKMAYRYYMDRYNEATYLGEHETAAAWYSAALRMKAMMS